MARHFHALRVAGTPPITDAPLVVYLNHPGWWDPLICLLLARHYFPDRRHYAPIEAAQLERYRVFRKLGFFPVEKHSRRGAAQFLRGAEAALAQPRAVLWVTAQGRFADVRERPVGLEPGVAHLARRVPGAMFVPLALEYPFWSERCPEALARWGESIAGDALVGRASPRGEGLTPVRGDARTTIEDAEQLLETRLGETQDALAASAVRRDPADFEMLLRGNAGVGGFYDAWRRWRARWRGEKFEKEHEA